MQGRIKKVVDHEVALQSAERLNVVAIETAQAKNEFLMAMSHELRTPVVEIIGASPKSAGFLTNRPTYNYVKSYV